MSAAPEQPLRRFPRLRRSRPVLLVPGTDQGGSYGRLAVIGRGGAEVVTARCFEPGTPLDLEIYLAGAFIQVQGRTTSCRWADEDHLVGIAFTGCPPGQEELLRALFDDRD
ncbi:MAG TPA: PilZ domain-containing protein [Thermoanaerobaculia bacterium]|nr:PilZ domain-containing protein [Thermoanaerobaculia bacterium]